ncbi:unknown [Fusobacterium sp. CAG:439]|mgnify:FL=1|nr:unknown [Fusobacterium sp. CAG:439]
MSRNFIDRFYEEDTKDRFWSLNKKIGACLVVLFLTVIMINTTGCTQNGTDDAVVEEPAAAIVPQDTVKVGNDGVNAAIAPDEVSVVADQSAKNSTMIAMSVEDMGRSDPFLPESEKVVVKPKPKFATDLVPPPETISVDTTATEIMTTKVSGIMFDKFNPSAILNINGMDYLVRSGDIINGYKILSIGQETVTVQYGANVYKASVGELFTGDGIKYNTVSNLENKFGSRSNKAVRN